MNDLKSMSFPVKELPAIITGSAWSDEFPAEATNTGHKFIVREDTGKILSCMSKDYKLVTNKEIINYAEPIVNKRGGKFKEAEIFGNGARSIMKWHFPKEKVKVSKDDILHPEIMIKNSYDGTIGVNVVAGAFRLICSNGMVIGITTNSYKNKHSIHNIELNDLENIIEDTIENTKYLFDEEFPKLIESKIQEKDIVNLVKMFPIYANEIVIQRLIADNPKTYWDLFNVGTNVLSHHMKRDSETTHSIERRLYPSIKKWSNNITANA